MLHPRARLWMVQATPGMLRSARGPVTTGWLLSMAHLLAAQLQRCFEATVRYLLVATNKLSSRQSTVLLSSWQHVLKALDQCAQHYHDSYQRSCCSQSSLINVAGLRNVPYAVCEGTTEALGWKAEALGWNAFNPFLRSRSCLGTQFE